MTELSEVAHQVIRFINQTQRSIFLTGKAGTGKTTLLNYIVQNTHKRTAVVAPTGIAALNAKGVTIHSMFQLPFAGFVPAETLPENISEHIRLESRNTLYRHFQMSGLKRSVIQGMQLLIIDEVSMLRPDVLDAMDFMLQRVRRNRKTFGGVQVLFIGDLMQLPPVIKNEEWIVLQKYYTGKFFFHAHAVLKEPPLYIELDKIYRQQDPIFIDILNNLRNNRITLEDQAVLNQYVNPTFDPPKDAGYITLSTHNQKADEINKKALLDLLGAEYKYRAEVVGEFPDRIYPIEEQLILKIGAQVMFVKNDMNAEKRYFNGKMGIVTSLKDQEILVRFPDENTTIEVEKYEWQNIRYKVNENTKEIEEEVLGTFVQYPIKLAWAITVHKSQGLTFDKAILDVSQVFVAGQLYVALSRLRSLQGMVLLESLKLNGIQNSHDVMQYANNKADEGQLTEALTMDRQIFIQDFVVNSFDWASFEQQIRTLVYSYKEKSEKGKDSKEFLWGMPFLEKQKELTIMASKFVNQLNVAFQVQLVDIKFISTRLNAANAYFLPLLKEQHKQLLFNIETTKRQKRNKTYFNELSELDDAITSLIIQIYRASSFVECIIEEREINKESLQSYEAINYKRLLREQVVAELANTKLIADSPEDSYYDFIPKKKKKSKTDKKDTLEETFEIWGKTKSVKEIASERMLSETTIYGHMAKLVRLGKVTLEELLTPKRLEELSAIFKEIPYDMPAGQIKEKIGTTISWEEIRLMKGVPNE
jgi:GTPase SAR1 family protein